MKVIGLDGKTYTLKLKQAAFDDDNRSKGHLYCRKLLWELYPSDNIFEEVELPGTKGLTADFIMPLRRLLLEIHGQQHYHYNPFFHKNKLDFEQGKNRDAQKKQWAELNNFIYVELSDKVKNDWRAIILSAYD